MCAGTWAVLHSRVLTFTVTLKEKCPDEFWVEWRIP